MSTVSIMYSGGLDSYIMYHYAKATGHNPLCISVDLGHPYAEIEWQSYCNMPDNDYKPNVIRLNFSDLYPAIANRITNQIIPSRNVLLAVIGSMFNSRVWLGVLDGEQNGKEHDKSYKYFQDTTNLLTFTNSFFQEATIVETPFSHMTKAQTIGWALQYGIPEERLFETTSCYSGTHKKCGVCLTCYKRKVAFLLNGIDEPGYDKNPLKTSYAREMDKEIPLAIAKNDYSRFTKTRCDEWTKLKNILK